MAKVRVRTRENLDNLLERLDTLIEALSTIQVRLEYLYANIKTPAQ